MCERYAIFHNKNSWHSIPSRVRQVSLTASERELCALRDNLLEFYYCLLSFRKALCQPTRLLPPPSMYMCVSMYATVHFECSWSVEISVSFTQVRQLDSACPFGEKWKMLHYSFWWELFDLHCYVASGIFSEQILLVFSPSSAPTEIEIK